MINLYPAQAASNPAAWPISNEWSVTDIARKVDRAIGWYGWSNLSIQGVNSLGDGSVRVELASDDRSRRRSLVVDRHTGKIRL